jgi:ubiquitin carboxyl-terminal hydrolase 8
MEQLQDETNIVRDHGSPNPILPAPRMEGVSILQAAAQYWAKHCEFSQSIVDKYWRGMEVTRVECLNDTCHNFTFTWSTFDHLSLPVPKRANSLLDCLKEYTMEEQIDDFMCDKCNTKRPAKRKQYIVRMPKLLCIGLQRYAVTGNGIVKESRKIEFDFNNLDMDEFFLPKADRSLTSDASKSDAFNSPFNYECYGVISHLGRSIQSGHYQAYVRQPAGKGPYAWLHCNDSQVSPVTIGSGTKEDIREKVFKTGDALPYILFYRRKGDSS